MKITKIIKKAQKTPETLEDKESTYTIRSMLKDLSKWDQILKMMR